MNRKQALKRFDGLVPRIEEHLGKIQQDPANQDAPHWAQETEAWIRQVEDLFPHVGQKTAEERDRRIREWKERLET